MPASVQQTESAKILLAGPVLGILLSLGACNVSSPAQGYRDVTASQLHARIQQTDATHGQPIIIDVRTPQEFRSGHIRGAVLMPVDTLQAHLNNVPKDRAVYVYCQGGVRSARAARLLAAHGYTRIGNMQGGIEAWKKAGYEVVQP